MKDLCVIQKKFPELSCIQEKIVYTLSYRLCLPATVM